MRDRTYKEDREELRDSILKFYYKTEYREGHKSAPCEYFYNQIDKGFNEVVKQVNKLIIEMEKLEKEGV